MGRDTAHCGGVVEDSSVAYHAGLGHQKGCLAVRGNIDHEYLSSEPPLKFYSCPLLGNRDCEIVRFA